MPFVSKKTKKSEKFCKIPIFTPLNNLKLLFWTKKNSHQNKTLNFLDRLIQHR